MRTSLVSVSAVATLAAAVSFLYVARPSPEHPATPTAHAEGTKLLARLPVAFVPILGQWKHPARFVARIRAMAVDRKAAAGSPPSSVCGIGRRAKGEWIRVFSCVVRRSSVANPR